MFLTILYCDFRQISPSSMVTGPSLSNLLWYVVPIFLTIFRGYIKALFTTKVNILFFLKTIISHPDYVDY